MNAVGLPSGRLKSSRRTSEQVNDPAWSCASDFVFYVDKVDILDGIPLLYIKP